MPKAVGIDLGTTNSVVWALFESVSGFTTPGATVFAVIEELPASILLWRSLSHWIGGMGIIHQNDWRYDNDTQ